MAPGTEGGFTTLQPDGKVMSVYEAAMEYKKRNNDLVVIAGKEYGTGSSRDWAAKGTKDLFNLIMHKKITFRGLLAWVVITPPAMLIGSYIVLSQKLDRILGRSSVRGITG